jgi:hypothetical protein
VIAHKTMTGVTTSAPATLPSHQVKAMAGKRTSSADPARMRLPTPSVALISVPGARHSSTNRATPLGLSKVLLPSDHIIMR